MFSALRRLVLPACILGFALALGAASRPLALGRVQTDDRNHDGRPDVWRFFDARGKLTRVAIDANFDGRPDQEEVYQHEALTRRSSDRNFDQRVDLVEEFDPITHERVRSLVDVDYDGRADLLVLFASGRPVHSEWAATSATPAAAPGARRARPASFSHDQLAPLEDPFAATSAFGVASIGDSSDSPAVASLTALAEEPIRSTASSLPLSLVGAAPAGPHLASCLTFAGPRAPPAGILN